jgi:2-keto-3-deoxy-L-rhamnonate aldolase RhmA
VAQLSRNEFKHALEAGKSQLGYWLLLQSPTATELVAASGIDWMLLDMEHYAIDLVDVERHLLAARASGGKAELVVRVPSVDPVLVKRLLDVGVRTIMYPMVDTVEQARLAVAATRYPPLGIRGVSSYSRANGYTQIKDYAQRYADEICVIVQAESAQSVDALPEIAAVEGVDIVFIGPADLNASMGFHGTYGNPTVAAKIKQGLASIKAAGKIAATVDFNLETAAKAIDDGFLCMAIGADGWSISSRVGPDIEAVRKAQKR